jgi:hypothetical protein
MVTPAGDTSLPGSALGRPTLGMMLGRLTPRSSISSDTSATTRVGPDDYTLCRVWYRNCVIESRSTSHNFSFPTDRLCKSPTGYDPLSGCTLGFEDLRVPELMGLTKSISSLLAISALPTSKLQLKPSTLECNDITTSHNAVIVVGVVAPAPGSSFTACGDTKVEQCKLNR